MISFRAFRTLLVGVTTCGLWCSLSDAQQTKKSAPKSQTEQPVSRPRPKSDGTEPIARPKSKTAERDIEPVAGSDAPRKVRPKTQELRIEPLPPELEQLLKDWERESAKVKTLTGEHKRIVYNKVFEVEKWAMGKFFYESPDKGRIDLEGITPKKGEKSKKISDTSGQPYKLEADQETKWICTGKEILEINDSEKTFQAFPLPKELQGQNIIHGPLPFLFGMKADEAKRRFEISYEEEGNPKKNNETVVWIKAVPRQMADKENFQQATIILDRKRFLPLAVKLLDPSGNLETIYNFPADTLHVNKQNLIPSVFRDKPFQPTLRGYKMIQQQVVTPGDSKSDAREQPGRSDIRQVSAEGEGKANKAPKPPYSPSNVKKVNVAPKHGQ